MSLVNFAKKVREILEKGDNATLPELQNVVLKDLEDAYNKLKEEKLTIKLKHNGEKEYKVYPFDSLLKLKFKHRVESKLDKKGIDELDNANNFMHLPDGKMIEVSEIDTFEQLIKKHGEPSYFSFEVKNIEKITTKIQAKVRGHQSRQKEGGPDGDCKGTNKKCPDVDKRIKGKQMSNKARKSICNSYAGCKWEEKAEVKKATPTYDKDELLAGECKGTNKKCPDVDERIHRKKMSNKARRSICNSYAGCDWEKKVEKEVMLGGRKKKRRKKKKAFPSRKKTHRKNSTKKRARK